MRACCGVSFPHGGAYSNNGMDSSLFDAAAKAFEFFRCNSVNGGAHRCCYLPVSDARSFHAL
jgi:hypothetical protein